MSPLRGSGGCGGCSFAHGFTVGYMTTPAARARKPARSAIVAPMAESGQGLAFMVSGCPSADAHERLLWRSAGLGAWKAPKALEKRGDQKASRFLGGPKSSVSVCFHLPESQYRELGKRPGRGLLSRQGHGY